MLRPLIKTIISYKYPLIDNPFYENDYLIGSSELAKLILISEKETNRTLEDLEEKIKVLSAVIFGSITERYTKRKIRLNPDSDIDLFIRIKDYNKSKSYFTTIFKKNFYEYKKSLFDRKNRRKEKGIFLLDKLNVIISEKKLRDWEESQGIGFYIDNFYSLNLSR